MRNQIIKLVLCLAVCFSIFHPSSASAQDLGYSISAVYSGQSGATNQVGLGDRLMLQVKGLPNLLALATNQGKPVILFLNNIPLKGIYAEAAQTDPQTNLLQFYLIRNAASKPTWSALLGHSELLGTLLDQSPAPGVDPGHLKVSVALGLEDDTPRILTNSDKTIQLTVVRRWPLIGFLGLLVMLGFLIYYLSQAGMLRDFGPTPPGMQKPFSLVQIQMAWWFLLGGGSFLFIWMITGVYDSLTSQVLTLMGVGTATALGTHIQNASKKNPDAPQVQQLFNQRDKLNHDFKALVTPTAVEQAQFESHLKDIDTRLCQILPTANGLVDDLLTDADGISFHRFQMAVWTILLGIIFIVEVWRSLSMPEFSDTLLTLMGISSATYLGFMMTEPHSSQMATSDPDPVVPPVPPGTAGTAPTNTGTP